jgi:MtN3 and saliva related transmembrane protein
VPPTHIDLVGYSAAACTTLAFVPQVLKIHRERSTDDISAGMYVIYIAGIGLWLAYGVLVGSWPIILANSATICLAISVLWMKWRFTRRDGVAAPGVDR